MMRLSNSSLLILRLFWFLIKIWMLSLSKVNSISVNNYNLNYIIYYYNYLVILIVLFKDI